MTADLHNKAQPKRRWYQYSLRTLLIIVTLFAIACSWFAVKMQQARRQEEAVDALNKLGAFVNFDNETDLDGNWSNWKTIPGPEWSHRLLGYDFFRTVTRVNLSGKESRWHGLMQFTDCIINDNNLALLEALKETRYLDLESANITDAGLGYLAGLIQVHDLNLSYTKVTDAGLTQLKGMTKLHHMNLSKTGITDAGLRHLERLSQLQDLDLDYTQITDTGLEYLKDLKQLHWLSIEKTLVSDAGVKELQIALPSLKIRQ